MKRYYIAYGSNLNVQQMRWRCPGARIIGTSELKDYRLLFKGSKTGSYLTIEPEMGYTVPVAVWEVSAEDERALDRYEGYPISRSINSLNNFLKLTFTVTHPRFCDSTL